jgi:hypothetical protein
MGSRTHRRWYVTGRGGQEMNTLVLILVGFVWISVFVAAVGIGHWVTQTRWRRQADNRAFDSMVEDYRRQQDAWRTP